MTRKQLLTTVSGAAALLIATGGPASAQNGDQYIGDIIATGYTFCPQYFTEAAGQTLTIREYTALFSLIGTTYGGDGVSYFNLPDLRGRTPVHAGTGIGLQSVQRGQSWGTERNTMTVSNMAVHGHSAGASTAAPNQTSPQGHAIGSFSSGPNRYAADTPNLAMEPGTVTSTGNGAVFSNLAPVSVLRYCIALQGLYPPRN